MEGGNASRAVIERLQIRYQKIADFAERCCFFCRKTAWFAADREISEKFSVFHKIAAAFLDRIRGPPSEI